MEKIGAYEVVSELGRGGMGVVYKAFDRGLGRHVAIKILAESISRDEIQIQRFIREAQSVAALNHPNIVQVFAIDQQGDCRYFVMEFVNGSTLSQLLRERGRLPPKRAIHILKQAAAGLGAAHDEGIIHRDIKPGNILLDQKGWVKIADFGIARAPDLGNKLTATGQFLGTPGYISPEVCQGEELDQRSDIFSLGIVFFEMLVGRIPFHETSPLALLREVVEAEIPDVRQLNTEVDDHVQAILAKMLAKKKVDRYNHCGDLIADLDRYLASDATIPRTVPLPASMAPTIAEGIHLSSTSAATELLNTAPESTAAATVPLNVPPPMPTVGTASEGGPPPIPDVAYRVVPPTAKKRARLPLLVVALAIPLILLFLFVFRDRFLGEKVQNVSRTASNLTAEPDTHEPESVEAGSHENPTPESTAVDDPPARENQGNSLVEQGQDQGDSLLEQGAAEEGETIGKQAFAGTSEPELLNGAHGKKSLNGSTDRNRSDVPETVVVPERLAIAPFSYAKANGKGSVHLLEFDPPAKKNASAGSNAKMALFSGGGMVASPLEEFLLEVFPNEMDDLPRGKAGFGESFNVAFAGAELRRVGGDFLLYTEVTRIAEDQVKVHGKSSAVYYDIIKPRVYLPKRKMTLPLVKPIFLEYSDLDVDTVVAQALDWVRDDLKRAAQGLPDAQYKKFAKKPRVAVVGVGESLLAVPIEDLLEYELSEAAYPIFDEVFYPELVDLREDSISDKGLAAFAHNGADIVMLVNVALQRDEDLTTHGQTSRIFKSVVKVHYYKTSGSRLGTWRKTLEYSLLEGMTPAEGAVEEILRQFLEMVGD